MAEKICSRCQRNFKTLVITRVYCNSCKELNKYIRKSKRVSKLDAIMAIESKGGIILSNFEDTKDVSVAFLWPGERVTYIVRMDSRAGCVHLVARYEGEAIKFIPTCYHSCLGCYKCRSAAILNDESPEDARSRRHDRKRYHRVYPHLNHYGGKILSLPLKNPCNGYIDPVYSSSEDQN